MRRPFVIGAGAIAGGVIALGLSGAARRRLAVALRRRVLQRMQRMMATLPEDSPPRLIVSVLPRLEKQNDQIIAMLRDQNELLRKHLEPTPSRRSEGRLSG